MWMILFHLKHDLPTWWSSLTTALATWGLSHFHLDLRIWFPCPQPPLGSDRTRWPVQSARAVLAVRRRLSRTGHGRCPDQGRSPEQQATRSVYSFWIKIRISSPTPHFDALTLSCCLLSTGAFPYRAKARVVLLRVSEPFRCPLHVHLSSDRAWGSIDELMSLCSNFLFIIPFILRIF